MLADLISPSSGDPPILLWWPSETLAPGLEFLQIDRDDRLLALVYKEPTEPARVGRVQFPHLTKALGGLLIHVQVKYKRPPEVVRLMALTYCDWQRRPVMLGKDKLLYLNYLSETAWPLATYLLRADRSSPALGPHLGESLLLQVSSASRVGQVSLHLQYRLVKGTVHYQCTLGYRTFKWTMR